MAIDHNIERLAAYFHAGCRTKQQQRLGVEVEHFIVDSNGQAAAYETIADMMKQAIQQTDALFYEENRLLGYDNQEFSISLEPAAQLEISVMPQHTIEEIERILQKFYRLYEPILQAEGYHFVTLGYHPVCLAQELPLIPKKRYEYMNDYFQASGRKGIQMMRATASTQVSVDYESEADFREKYRLAVVLTPMLALLTDNAPVYEGQRNEKHLARALVWADVDADRCGLVPGCMEENFGFTAYASYIYERPMIVMKEGNRTIYTHDTCVSQYYDGRKMTTEEIEHMITMFFPDVRLKHYIEIRMADSMPAPMYLLMCS